MSVSGENFGRSRETDFNRLLLNITEKEAFTISALYKTQIYRINRSSLGRTIIMGGETIKVHKSLVRILKGKGFRFLA
jgi:hypothetical protein